MINKNRQLLHPKKGIKGEFRLVHSSNKIGRGDGERVDHIKMSAVVPFNIDVPKGLGPECEKMSTQVWILRQQLLISSSLHDHLNTPLKYSRYPWWRWESYPYNSLHL